MLEPMSSVAVSRTVMEAGRKVVKVGVCRHKEALLVPRAAFPQNIQKRIIPDLRLRQRAVGNR